MAKKRRRPTKVAKKKRQHRSRPYLGPSGPFGPPIIITESFEPFPHPWRIAVIFDVDATTDLEAAEKGFDIADAAIVSGPEFDVVCCRVDMTGVIDDLGPRELSAPTDQGEAVG
jgi:hypothetical protein